MSASGMNETDRAKSVFLGALEIATVPERQAFLERQCAGEGALLAEVEELLRHHEGLGDYLERPAIAAPETEELEERRLSDRPGAVVGAYKLLEEIGEGGFGVVYMAEQAQPMRRRVALKLLKLGMDSRQIVARFEAERQALAIMDHPNIAKVLDGGATLSGRPYFVMELVKGVPITEYCDANHLSPRQRLELFIPICHAVQHAHQKGIIHRDLKPSNVLVTIHDTKPVPKIIDFGVAKALGQELTEKTLFTGFAQMIGTPMYMSPEQAGQSGLDVDTRADIYSLGVLLYELLTGTPPFARERFSRAGFDEIRRIIREEEPPKPSTRLSDLGRIRAGGSGIPGEDRTKLASVSALRRTEPTKLTKLVRGELDWIVMKCLEKDRNLRYESASGIAMDLDRYLANEPVRACPPSTSYRLRKFTQRHRVALTTAGLVAAVLVLGAGVSLWFGIRATSAEDLAEKRLGAEEKARMAAVGERDRAQRRLFDSRLAEARAARSSRRIGQRFDAWRAIAEASGLARELLLDEDRLLELRNEAIACLTLSDLRLAHGPWQGWPPGSSSGWAFDAELARYARCDPRGTVRVREVAGDRLLVELPGPASAARMRFNSDGTLLAVAYFPAQAGQASTFRLWDWRKARMVFEADGGIDTMDFAPDGRSIVLGRLNGTLTIHETESGGELRRVRLDEPPFDLKMSGDGARIAVSNPSGALVIRDVVTGDVLRTLTVPGGVWTAAWHPEGELIAAASEDANVYLFSTRSGATHTVMRGHQAAVVHVAFVPSGNMLLTSSYDGTSRLWDVWTGRELLRWSGAAGTFSRDGGKVAIRAGYDFQIWDVSSGREYRTLPAGQSPGGEHIQGGGVSLDGRLLAVSQGGDHKIWDLRSGAVAMIYAEPGAADARFHPTRNELFTSGRTGLFRWPVRDESNALRIGPPERLRLSAPTGRIAFDRSGQTLAAADRGGAWVLKLDKLDSQKLEFVKRVEHINAQECALSPDGRWLATGTQNGFGIKVWNASTGQLANPEPLFPDERQTTVAFSPDGRWLVTGTENEFGVWEVGTWQLRRRIPKDQPVGRSQIAFTADGGVLAIDVASGVVLLLDPLTGGSLARLEPPEPLLISWMSFTTEGSELIVCAESGQIAVWDLRQIRAQLRAIELDWEPPLLTRGDTRLPVVPITMDVHSGEIMRAVESLNHEVRAIEQETARDWPQVIDAYTKAISVDSENARARNNLAWLYLTGPTEVRDYQKALTLAEEAVRLEHYRGEWLNTLGVAYYRAGQWEKAISTLKLGIDAQGGHAMAFDLFFLAMSHYRLGHRERARELYHQALSWWRQQKDLPAEWVKDLGTFRTETEALLQLDQGR